MGQIDIKKVTDKKLKKKYEEIQQLTTLIKIASTKMITREVHSQVSELQDRLQFRLAQLTEEFLNKEVDLKIEIYKRCLALLKQ